MPASVWPDEYLSIFILNFINIFSISSGYGQTEYYPSLHKALLVVSYNMKFPIYILLLAALSFPSRDKEVEITLVILPELQRALQNAPISIQISSDDLKVDTTITNISKLNFKEISGKVLWIHVYSSFKCSDSLTEKSFYETTRLVMSDSAKTCLTIHFPFNCELNKYTGGKICPTCKRIDKVIPIFFGLPDPLSLKGEPGIDFDLGGCIRTSCDPKWHCKRDNKDF